MVYDLHVKTKVCNATFRKNHTCGMFVKGLKAALGIGKVYTQQIVNQKLKKVGTHSSQKRVVGLLFITHTHQRLELLPLTLLLLKICILVEVTQ